MGRSDASATVDWRQVGSGAADLLSRYIRFDTTNPPGNEAQTARFLSGFLDSNGVKSTIVTSPGGRANLIARVRGTGQRKPLVLLHHMDVVPARDAPWERPPFGGVIADGFVWGRGAIDDKGLGVMHLMAFALLGQRAKDLSRDIVLIAVSDEEDGGAEGAGWLVERFWDDIDPELVWDEGGAGAVGVMGKRPVFAVAVAEKRSLAVRLTARGRGGHGSMAGDSAIERLTRALRWIADNPRPVRFGPTTRDFFRKLGEAQSWPASALVANAWRPIVGGLVRRRTDKIPSLRAMVRDTLEPTGLSAGDRPNVAPASAQATMDARLLPGTEVDELADWLRRSLREWGVDVEVKEAVGSVDAAPTGGALLAAMERVIPAIEPDAIVAPMVTPVATDSRFFRSRGASACGLIPALLGPDDLSRIHGVDERISLDNLTLGCRIVYEVAREVCGPA